MNNNQSSCRTHGTGPWDHYESHQTIFCSLFTFLLDFFPRASIFLCCCCQPSWPWVVILSLAVSFRTGIALPWPLSREPWRSLREDWIHQRRRHCATLNSITHDCEQSDETTQKAATTRFHLNKTQSPTGPPKKKQKKREHRIASDQSFMPKCGRRNGEVEIRNRQTLSRNFYNKSSAMDTEKNVFHPSTRLVLRNKWV